MSNLGDVLSKLVYLGEAPSRWAIFVRFWKKNILIPLDHISHVFIAILKELDFYI